MKMKKLGALLLVAWAAMSCSEEAMAPKAEWGPVAVGTTHQEVRSTNRVLILGSSVSGGLNSREAQAVTAYEPTAQIDVVTPVQWSALTATQFMSYRAIIIGDAACQTGTAAFQAAIDNRATWGPIIDGDVAIMADNPVSNNTAQIVENGVHFVLNSLQDLTGMYISLGCAYRAAAAPTHVELLEPFGEFKVQGLSTCADFEHMFEMYNDLISQDLFDGLLVGDDGCATKTVFTSYPDHTFSYAAVAANSSGDPVPGQGRYSDFNYDHGTDMPVEGTPYILVRGAAPYGAGCGNTEWSGLGEECELGDGVNGMPNDGSQDAGDTCSWSCHLNWCGDGVVDTAFGEECDSGINNGRSSNTSGVIGTCSSFCKIPHIPSNNNPPVALCADRTVEVTNTCGMAADINNGSFDLDGDLVGCVQSPAGPYKIGNTTVSLMCSDPNQSASCSATVTVTDKVLPTVALNGNASQAIECVSGGTYVELGATASDLCEGPLPQSAITKGGTVNMGALNTYDLTYYATDSSGNKSAIVTRTVNVVDTNAPILTLNGLANMGVECGYTFVDPGATAIDQCAGSLTLSIDRTGTVNTAALGNYPLRYNVRDPSGKVAAERSRVVTVSDTQRPTVTIPGPTSQTVECGDGTYRDPGATASDRCAGALLAEPTAMADPNTLGSYVINYKATDPSGNVGTSATSRLVTVSDTLPPTLALNGQPVSALECGTPYRDPGATASDQCKGNLNAVIEKTGTVNVQVPDTYSLHYTVSDGSGHSVSTDRRVVVADTLPPSITVNGPLSEAVECGSIYVDPGATATDACDGAVTVISSLEGDPTQPGTMTISYSAMDAAGHQASPTIRTVQVTDNTPPTLALLGDATVNLECNTPFNDPGSIANDQCDGDLSSQTTWTSNVDTTQPGSYSVTYSVTDRTGLSAAPLQREVNVLDTQRPVITVNGPLDILMECDASASYTDPGATASDACTGTLPAVPNSSPDPHVPGFYTVIYTATDPSGNVGSSETPRTVRVTDSAPPVLTLIGPATMSVACNSSYVDPGATATDACLGDLTHSIYTVNPVNTAMPGRYLITYSVQDETGNSAPNVYRTVTVEDCPSSP